MSWRQKKICIISWEKVNSPQKGYLVGKIGSPLNKKTNWWGNFELLLMRYNYRERKSPQKNQLTINGEFISGE